MSTTYPIDANGLWLCYPVEVSENHYTLLVQNDHGNLYVIPHRANITTATIKTDLARLVKVAPADITYQGEERLAKRSKLKILRYYIMTAPCPF